MKKFNKTQKLSIFLFIFFAFIFNIVSASVTVWSYKEISTSKIHGDFTSLEECKSNRDTFSKSTLGQAYPTTECVSKISDLPVVTTKTDEPTSVSVQQQPVDLTEETYKLLAPINGTSEVKTTNIGNYINTIIKVIIGICAALAVIMIILAGIQWMGDESVFGRVEAKGKIGAAILGLIIALGSYALLNTINPDLLGKNGLSINGVNIELESEPIPWSTYSSGGDPALCPEGFQDVPTFGKGEPINVCKTIAVALTNTLAKAKAEGIILGGYGSRSIEQQMALRIKNKCPDPKNSKAEACTPPTARPGRSMHQSGEAIDFSCNGTGMMASGGKNSVCYKWLAANTAISGLKNLASEPWHWSTTGH